MSCLISFSSPLKNKNDGESTVNSDAEKLGVLDQNEISPNSTHICRFDEEAAGWLRTKHKQTPRNHPTPTPGWDL